MQMPERHNQYGPDGNYRYAYNGMEVDNEVSGNGNSYTTEFRQYDPRLGRWKSLDPLMASFPWLSPYCAFDNNPVFYVDPYGLKSEVKGDPDKSHHESGTGLPESYRNDGHRWKGGDTYTQKLENGLTNVWTRTGNRKSGGWILEANVKDGLIKLEGVVASVSDSDRNRRRKNVPENMFATRSCLEPRPSKWIAAPAPDTHIGENLQNVGDVITGGGIVMGATPLAPFAIPVTSFGEVIEKLGTAIVIIDHLNNDEFEEAGIELFTSVIIPVGGAPIARTMKKSLKSEILERKVRDKVDDVIIDGVIILEEKLIEKWIKNGLSPGLGPAGMGRPGESNAIPKEIKKMIESFQR